MKHRLGPAAESEKNRSKDKFGRATRSRVPNEKGPVTIDESRKGSVAEIEDADGRAQVEQRKLLIRCKVAKG
jgi:hypothetical protein